MGFEQAGFETVWTNELDKDFAKLHAAGITSWRKSQGNGIKAEIFNTKSITEVSSKEIIAEATLTIPTNEPFQKGGKTGKHSEHLGHILTELQWMQRTYPGAAW